MGSTRLILEWVAVNHLSDHILSAVASRLTRQQSIDVDTKVVVRSNILCEGEESASAISALMQHCRRLDLGVHGHLKVAKDIGREGWTALREALSWRLHDVPHLYTGCKIYVASARREELRAIWECLSLSWSFRGDGEVFARQRGEEGWRSLEQFLDLTNEEWRAAKRAAALAHQQAMGAPLHLVPGQLEHLIAVDENGQQVHIPVANLAANVPVAFHVGPGGAQVQVAMPQPGEAGLIQALQQAMQEAMQQHGLPQQLQQALLALGPQPPVAQVEEGGHQVEEGQL